MKLFTFTKNQRLSLQRDIDDLFRNGRSIICGQLRIIYRLVDRDDTNPIRILVSVPRRKFRRATVRNRIKRLIREAFRLNRISHFHNNTTFRFSIHAAFIYTGDSGDPKSGDVQNWVIEALKQLAREASSERRTKSQNKL